MSREKTLAREDTMGEGTDSRTARETPAGSSLPLRLSSRKRGFVEDASGLDYAIALGVDGDVRAEFIVRAVNSHEALVSALKRLANEVGGLVGICELEMRGAAGNTNVNVLMQRLDEARAALALTEGK